MKTRIYTLMIALLTFVMGAQATEGIKSLKMTIIHDGDEFTESFPASDWPQQVINGRTTSIKIKRVEVETDESILYVGFIATMYDAEDGWQHNDDEWRTLSLENKGGGKWVLDMGEGAELVESEWLSKNKTKTFEFFIYADYGQNTTSYHYNNGGQNYKVTFSTGEGGGETSWKVKFFKEETATLELKIDDSMRIYTFGGNAGRDPGTNQQPGQLKSLVIDGFSVSFIYNDDVKISDVSLQYKVYEEGTEAGWNRIDCTRTDKDDIYNSEKDRVEHLMVCSADKLEREVAAGLETGKNYVLEAHYQVVTADGDYIFLGKNAETSMFRFSISTDTAIESHAATQPSTDVRYNLSGQRVDQSYKGIVITPRGKFIQ